MNNLSRKFATSVDVVVDFATLGEYRVITESAPRKVETEDVWAIDVEWNAPERDRTACTLPRARDRKLARAAIAR